MREKYLKSGFGKRYLKNRLKRFLSHTTSLRDKSPTGFTLLEVVIALAVLSIGLLGLLRAIPVGLEASGRGHDVTVALLLAEQKLEELRYSPWPPLVSDGTFGPPGDNFDWEIATVTLVTPTSYLCEVPVNVYWPAAAGDTDDRSKQRYISVTAYLANYSN